jgi:hypothetical protein
VRSPLQVHLVAPTEKTLAYANQAVQIQAEFLNGTDQVTPAASDNAQIVAKVTLFVNGRTAGVPTNDIVLNQQKGNPLFSGKTLVYNQPGVLQIEIDGTYKNVQRQSSFTLQLLLAPVYIPPCPLSCMVQRYIWPILIGIIIVLFLVVAGLIAWRFIRSWSERPKPYGYITNGRPNGEVELEHFKKAVISSRDLENQGSFRFGDAKFEFRFDPDGPKIRTQADNVAKVTIDIPNGAKSIELTNKPIELKGGTRINVDGQKVASFETISGRH